MKIIKLGQNILNLIDKLSVLLLKLEIKVNLVLTISDNILIYIQETPLNLFHIKKIQEKN